MNNNDLSELLEDFVLETYGNYHNSNMERTLYIMIGIDKIMKDVKEEDIYNHTIHATKFNQIENFLSILNARSFIYSFRAVLTSGINVISIYLRMTKCHTIRDLVYNLKERKCILLKKNSILP
jgi:hypothetical protein